MKETGIVRRLDELGRIVIPKELRRTLHLREGDSLEIYTENTEEIILKKYDTLGALSNVAQDFCSVLARCSAQPVLICNKSRIIAAAGTALQPYMNLSVTPAMLRIIQNKKLYVVGTDNTATEKEMLLPVTDGQSSQPVFRLAVPIIVGAQAEGCVLLFANAAKQSAPVTVTETERKMAVLTAELLAKQLQG